MCIYIYRERESLGLEGADGQPPVRLQVLVHVSYIYVDICMYIYIYIYIQRER